MGSEDIDVSVIISAAERECDRCRDAFDDGRITIRGEEVIEVICRSCIDAAGAGWTLH
jgi:hypothetical protein